jgi:soluble lytic murein transglycosylase-like protein
MAIADQIVAEAQAQGVDPSLALEVAEAESGINQNAISPKGAIGVFQLMPATAAGLGVNPYDLDQNIAGGIAYLAQLLAQFGGNEQAALAAYNAGPGTVSNLINSQPGSWFSALPSETIAYVNRILANLGIESPAQAAEPSLAPYAAPASTPAAPEIPWWVWLSLGALALLALL